MEGKKIRKIVLGVALVIVIVAAFGLVAKNLYIEGERPLRPDRLLNQQVALINMKPPYAMVTKTFAEWEKLGENEAGYYRNPDTKEFTMVSMVVCGRCGKRIPGPAYPQSLKGMPKNDREAETHKIQAEYKCPLCGQLAYPLARPGAARRGK